MEGIYSDDILTIEPFFLESTNMAEASLHQLKVHKDLTFSGSNTTTCDGLEITIQREKMTFLLLSSTNMYNLQSKHSIQECSELS